MSEAVALHPDKYEKDFETVVTIFTEYINKRAQTQSMKVASASEIRPAKQQKTRQIMAPSKGNFELKKHSREKFDSMSMVECKQLYELHKKNGLTNGKKTLESHIVLMLEWLCLKQQQKMEDM